MNTRTSHCHAVYKYQIWEKLRVCDCAQVLENLASRSIKVTCTIFYIFSKLTMILTNSLPPKTKLFSSGWREMEINFSNQLCKSCSPLHINTKFFVMRNSYLLLHCSAIRAGKGKQQLKRHMKNPSYSIHSRRRVAQGSEIATCFKWQLYGTFIYKNYCTIWE